MAQTGLFIPAKKAQIPIFDQILTDIGDQQSIANDLAAKFGQIDMQRQQMDFANTQGALQAQGTGAGQMAQIGQAQQQQAQNVLDAPYTGLTQLGEMFSNIAAKKTSTESDQGGK